MTLDPTIDDKAQEEDEQEEGQGQGHEREPEGVMSRISPPTYQDDLCERRRQQNREAQRRFRLKKAKEREAETHTQLAPIPNALSTTSHPINHVARAPIQQLRSSHDLSNSLVIDGSYEHRPSLHQTPSDTTPPASRQEHSSTTPKILIPSQPPQPQVSAGPTIYPAFDPQQSLLHIAIESGHEGIVRILLEEGVDINERNSEGSTALHMTVHKRQENILQLLLDKGANVDIADDKGRKPVHLAIVSDFQTGLRLLLRHKAATSFTTAQA
ncbi:hypothetical protein D6D28_02447 [Aureobasidium pullulans]|uniref:BZIP domain-containing protein n=1 Tax=Aureobasidium pullulans TaxID=5580 RepID=A0A4S8STY7_AURPU|nr:hypothetical protein D6D28_02447 [Aureobasidium pullulans]